MKDKINSVIKILSIILISLISILIILARPSITLKGDKEISIDLDKNYKEPGYVGSFILKDYTNKVIIKNNINNKKIGTYNVIYILKVKNLSVEKIRKVNIVDRQKPVIKLIGTGHACPNQEYKEEGYNAIDNYDGDLTDKVIIDKKSDAVTYRVRDSSNNISKQKRKIIYQDIEKPNIALNGEMNVNVYVGDEYNEQGYIITDNCDNNIQNKVIVSGNVDTNIPGKYTITYSVTDESGNSNSVNRIVNVIRKDEPPKIDGTGKNIYLTFDDGPSHSITPSLLQILKEENVKATFFVINHDDSLNYLIKQEADEGHTVALHSYTHNYSYIYSSVDNYFEDLNAIKEKVHTITGKNANIIRFPGGSSNTVSRRYSSGIMSILTKEVSNKGYIYFDWNVSCEDAGGARNSNDVYNNVVNNLVYQNNVVLMHDFESNYKTLNAIRNIINYGKENGYTFKAITNSTSQVRHHVNN